MISTTARLLPVPGLRANTAQFTCLSRSTHSSGAWGGRQQQTVLPLPAQAEFGLSGCTFLFAYVAAFGVA